MNQVKKASTEVSCQCPSCKALPPHPTLWLPQKGTLLCEPAMSGEIFGSSWGGGGCWHLCAEDRDAAQPPARYGQLPEQSIVLTVTRKEVSATGVSQKTADSQRSRTY